nr:GNAT family N-acetyltransferase [Neobacillus sp. Marseille-Q6967]
MRVIHFENITKETLYIALEIINSNKDYNLLENGVADRTLAEIEEEFLNNKTNSVFIKLDDTYIGVIDYLMENPKDHSPWLGLLVIHCDYQGYGFGGQAYALYENEMLNQGVKHIRIGIIKENLKAKQFWESNGFLYIRSAIQENGKEIYIYEKKFE